jgi:hypothetical protein
VAQEHERAHAILHARVPAELRLNLAREERALEHVPVLLLERLTRAPCDLCTQCGGLGGRGRCQVRACELTREQGRVEDVCARMLDWWKRWGLLRDLGEHVQGLCRLGRARLWRVSKPGEDGRSKGIHPTGQRALLG